MLKGATRLLATLWVLGLATVAWADAPLFMWVDKAGVMHATDRLASVPEPWFSMYSARLKEMEARGQAPSPSLPADTAPPPPAPQPTARPPATAREIEQQRGEWRALVARWRAELAAATAALQKADRAYNEAGMNPVLRQTPAVKGQLLTLDDELQAARRRVETARIMLQDTLPKKARDEHVPPLWLQ